MDLFVVVVAYFVGFYIGYYSNTRHSKGFEETLVDRLKKDMVDGETTVFVAKVTKTKENNRSLLEVLQEDLRN